MYHSVLVGTVLGHLEFAVAIPNHFNIQVITVDPITDNALFLDISIGLIEGDADKVGSEVSEKDVVEGRIEAPAFELDIIVDLVCYFVVVHLKVQILMLKYA